MERSGPVPYGMSLQKVPLHGGLSAVLHSPGAGSGHLVDGLQAASGRLACGWPAARHPVATSRPCLRACMITSIQCFGSHMWLLLSTTHSLCNRACGWQVALTLKQLPPKDLKKREIMSLCKYIGLILGMKLKGLEWE